MFDKFYTRVTKAPEFPPNFDWINSNESLSLEKLRGHVVVLDFWTYCCINCMHTLPVLAQLERRYDGKPVVFIGVHSAKFFNEQDRDNIEQAVRRYEISHPVLVDRKMAVWQKYEVSGWPTIVIIDPSGTIVYKQSGEGQKEVIQDTIDTLLENHGKRGGLAKVPIKITHHVSQDRTTLSYPGKLSISNDRIAISDSNHNRIIIVDMTGKIEKIIGSGKAGLGDGNFSDATFFRPQGLVFNDDMIFVADTENHAIRKIDLVADKVITVAGTGKQGPWMSAGGKGKETALSSPWDVAAKDNFIFVAMAGNHQIWTYDTKTDMVSPYAGNGYENIIDGERMRAQLAQPSGLSISDNILYFADSETSSVREIDLKSGYVRTIVGQGLFSFGHKDGSTNDALFQHPLGLCATQNQVFVADTYNSALRAIDLKNETVTTIIGKKDAAGICRLDDPSCDSLGLYEPSDVKWYKDMLYISDTNNHLIRVYDLKTNLLKTLQLVN